MKKAFVLFLLLCMTLTVSGCAQSAPSPTPEPTAISAAPFDGEFPEEITEGASELLVSMLTQTSGYLLKKGYPAMGMMQSTLYRTEDGQNWTPIREVHDDVHNYPKVLYFWDINSGVILTNYHGYDDCVYMTLDGGKTWEPLSIESQNVPSRYNYLEGEQASFEDGRLTLTLSVHYEDQPPTTITVSLDIS